MSMQKWKNPFYALLIPVGLAFCVTAFAYGFMAFQVVNGELASSEHADHPLYGWLNQHGTTAILVELAVLAMLTVGAIGTDHWWSDGDSQASDSQNNTPSN